jgi:hypothetical protein
MVAGSSRCVAFGLSLALLNATLGCSAHGGVPGPVIAATIDRDCAPWDGSAFTVSVPWWDTSALVVSIWRAPDIEGPVTFSFVDSVAGDGQAARRGADGSSEVLGGTVTFEGVQLGLPVVGRIRLRSAAGTVFAGTFRAEWGTTRVYCG